MPDSTGASLPFLRPSISSSAGAWIVQYFPVLLALSTKSLRLVVTSKRNGARAARSEKKKLSRPEKKLRIISCNLLFLMRS